MMMRWISLALLLCVVRTAQAAICTGTGVVTSGSTISSGNPYDNLANCVWELTCGATQFAGFRSAMLLQDTGDSVTFFDGTTTMRTVTSANDWTSTSGVISNTNYLRITFISSASGTNTGFNGQMLCYPARCSNNAAVSTITSFPALINSDTDGYGASATNRYSLGEDCSWPIQCPVGQFVYYTAKTASGTALAGSSTDARILFQNAAQSTLTTLTAATSPVAPGTINQRVIGTSNVGYLKFVTSVSSTTAPGRGFQMEANCLNYQCSLNTNSITTFPTTLLSDSDGITATNPHHRGENCAITVTCPAGKFVDFTYTGTIAAATGYVRFETTAAATIVQYTASVTGMRTVHSTNELVFKYVTSVSHTIAATAGFTIPLACLDTQCTAHTGTTPVTSWPYTFRSDADGVGTATKYNNGEGCVMELACPSGLVGKVDYSVSTADANDNLRIRDGSDASIAGPFSGTTTQTGSVQVTTATVKIVWTTNTDSTVGNGFTATATCTVACAADSPINPTYMARTRSVRILRTPRFPRSTIICPERVTAGQRATCEVHVRGSCSDYYGDHLDTTLLALTVCPQQPQLTNGDTSPITYHNSTFQRYGVFQFEIWPRVAGVNNITVAVGNPAYTIGPISIRVGAGEANLRTSTSSCSVDPNTGHQSCDVIHRDALGNRVKGCKTDDRGDLTPTSMCELL